MPMLCEGYENPVDVAGGHPGPGGAPYSGRPPIALSGTGGPVVVEAVSYSAASNIVSPDYTGMLLHAAEIDYLNGRFDSATSRLRWIANLLTPLVNTASEQGLQPKTQYEAQRDRVAVLGRQMQLGLDYFGNYQNYVPLLTAAYYKSLLDYLFSYGRSIEVQYNAYAAKDADLKQQAAALSVAQATTLENADRLQNELAGLLVDQQDLQKSIDALRDELDGLWVQLFTAESSFKRAVARLGGGCSFGQIAAIGSAVATLVATGGSAAALIGPALSALSGPGAPGQNGAPIPNDFSGFEYEVKTVVAAGQSVGDFMHAVDVARDKIGLSQPKDAPAPSLPGDETKLLAQAADIDKQLQPYLALPEARQYQALIHTFVTVAEARNNKVLEYNWKRAEYGRVSARITALRADANAIATKLAMTTACSVAGAMTFMESAYLQAKTEIVRVMYEVDRCHRFYTLSAAVPAFPVTDATIAALETTAVQQVSDYNGALVSYGVGLLKLTPEAIALGDFVGPQGLAALRDDGNMIFSLPPETAVFLGYSHVLAQKIQIDLKGLPKHTPYQAALLHLGRSLMIDDRGELQVFSHVMVPTAYEVGPDGRVIADGTVAGSVEGEGSAQFVGVSPYGPWKLRLRNLSQTQRKQITGIEVRFEAYARVRPALG